jgi:hypothetical protein
MRVQRGETPELALSEVDRPGVWGFSQITFLSAFLATKRDRGMVEGVFHHPVRERQAQQYLH